MHHATVTQHHIRPCDIDIFGHVIPGFYCAGESAGGFAMHGLGRAIVGGYIAASNAAKESKPKT